MKKEDIIFLKYLCIIACFIFSLFSVFIYFYEVDKSRKRYENRVIKSPCPPFKASFVALQEEDFTDYSSSLVGRDKEKKIYKETHYLITNQYDCDCLSEMYMSKFIYHYLDTIQRNKEVSWTPYIIGKFPIYEIKILNSSKELFFLNEITPRSYQNIDWSKINKKTIVNVELSSNTKNNKETIIQFSPFQCP